MGLGKQRLLKTIGARTMFPRKVGSAWEVSAPAKLNLYLEVLGPRADGFHELETLMAPVRIYDQLRWTGSLPGQPAIAPGVTLRTRCGLPMGASEAGIFPSGDSKNLVLRAAELLARTAGVEPSGRFELYKRIPIQAGLGGGSSDAAAALLLANAAWGIGYSRRRLAELAAELGSDVPFFLTPGAAVCRGRGERLEPVAALPHLHFVVVKPKVGLSTADVFAQLRDEARATARSSSARLKRLLEALGRGAVGEAGRLMTNRLESAAARLTPWIDRLRGEFARCGCLGHFMTGSGSAYVGVMRSARQTRSIACLLAGMDLGNVLATSSC